MNLPDPDLAQLWRQSIQRADAESAFRSKDELELRLIWHQHADRVQGHILICFIAYATWKTLAGWMHAAGPGDAARPLVEELSTTKSADLRHTGYSGHHNQGGAGERHWDGRGPERLGHPDRQ
jgi:hypothetical protein